MKIVSPNSTIFERAISHPQNAVARLCSSLKSKIKLNHLYIFHIFIFHIASNIY